MSVAAGEPAFQNGAVKGAILMLSLGYEQSAELLKLISDEQVQQITEAAQRSGVRDLRQSALLKIKNGVTSLAEINRVTKD